MFVLLFVLTQFDTEHVEAKCCYAEQYQRYERAESLHSFNVLKYELALTIPMTNRSLSGINNISCKSRTDGLDALTLHSYTLTIDSVKVDGVSATFGASDDTLHIDLPQTYDTDDSFSISVAYHGSWSVTGSQLGFLYYPKNYNVNTLHAIAYTMSEPWDARRWMPCYDEPYDKADYGSVISVTVPDTFMVCANGELIGETSNPDTTKTFTYQENYPITTYLMHFAVSRWTDWSTWHYEASGDSIELTYFVWPEDSAKADTSFQCIPIAMALFDSMYGSYPFDRYGQDAVFPFAWGGMEHQELSTIHRWWILGNEEGGMAHELAHMWWGDMVTCVDFRDIWLNEGFATYSDENYRWHRWGYDAFLSIMTSRRTSYFSADNYSRRPLYDPPTNDIFNYGYTYCKASWVVHMLRYLDVFDTGNDTTFFNAVAAYRDSFAYGTASTDDLNAVCSAVYGTDLTWFFDEWVYDQGHPQYDIYWVCNPYVSSYVTKIEISQIQNNAPPVFHMPVQIMLHGQSTDTLINIEIDAAYEYVEIIVSDSVTSIEFDPYLWLIEKHRIFLLDSVPPAAPYVTNVEKSDAHAQLTWTRISTDSLGGPESMDYYVIYRDTVPSFVPGESLAYVQHPETTYTDSNVLGTTEDYYYLVKAVDAKKQQSSRSNMAYVFHKTLNENIDATDKNWTSFPWSNNYASASDVSDDVSPTGDPLTKITNLRHDQHYESWLWDNDFLEWYGTDFAVVPGTGYELVTTSDTFVTLIGSNNPDGLVLLNENPATTDKNWVSIPYNAVYDSVRDITDEYSPAGNPLTKVTNLRHDQHYESWLWDNDFLEWYGTNFVIEEGRAYELVTTTDTSWNPTEFANSGGKASIAQNFPRLHHVHSTIGTSTKVTREPAWHMANGINADIRGLHADTSERGIERSASSVQRKASGVQRRAASHIVRAHVELDDCEDLVFTAYRPDAPNDMLTETMVGSGVAYKDECGALWFDAGNFDSPWVADEEIIIIIEATKNGDGYIACLLIRLDETVDIQELATVYLVAIPKPVVARTVAHWVELDNKHIIGYSLYENDIRINDDIIGGPGYAIERDVSLRLVFTGGIETVYSSHGVQSGSESEKQLHYAFGVLSNPSMNQIRMDYSLEDQIPVAIFIYDVSGRQVRLFDLGSQMPGHYTLLWNGCDDRGRRVPAGVYFVRFTAQTFAAQDKILLVR